MGKEFIGVRIDKDLKAKLETTANDAGETITNIVERALAEYLEYDLQKVDVHTLAERVRALETKFKSLSRESVSTPKKQRSTPPPTPSGDKVTIEQAAEITGYSVSTLSSKFSREGIQAVDRVDGNRAGLYSQKEILEKIGTK